MSDFHRVIAMNTLNGVGMGLVGIFIPIYLLEIGYSPSIVIVWLLVHHLTLLVGAFFAVWTSNRIGLVRCWFIRTVLIAGLFLGLFILPAYPQLLFFLALVSGIESAFFWIPYNIFIVRKTESSHMGASLAFMQNVGAIVGVVTPGIAAVLIVTYGYGVLFGVATLFVLLSLIPVLVLRKEKTSFQFRLSQMADIVRKNKQFILPEIFDNLGQDAGVIWTLFIFITALTILDIGALGVLVGIIGMVVTYITGQLIDRWNTEAVMRAGAILTTFLWLTSYLIAIYAPTPFMLYLVTALRGFALGIFASAYGAIMFNRARSSDAQFLVLREIPTIGGRVILFLFALYFISIDQVELTFLLVAALSTYFWFNNINKLTDRSG